MFASRLREKRESIGLSQVQAAEAINIAVSSYSAYETGKQLPRIDVLVRICREFNVSADWLLGLEHKTTLTTGEALTTIKALEASGASVLNLALHIEFPGGAAIANVIAVLLRDQYLANALNEWNTLTDIANQDDTLKKAFDVWLHGKLKFLDKPEYRSIYPFDQKMAADIGRQISSRKYKDLYFARLGAALFDYPVPELVIRDDGLPLRKTDPPSTDTDD